MKANENFSFIYVISQDFPNYFHLKMCKLFRYHPLSILEYPD